MSQGETLIVLLLGVIAYFLYQIVKQLSYITGEKFEIDLPKFPKKKFKIKKLDEQPPKLQN